VTSNPSTPNTQAELATASSTLSSALYNNQNINAVSNSFQLLSSPVPASQPIDAVGIGVGVSFGIVGLIIIIALVIVIVRRQQRNKRYFDYSEDVRLRMCQQRPSNYTNPGYT